MATKNLRNLLLSLAVVIIPVAVIMALFTHNPKPGPLAVEWQGPLATAKRDAPYSVLAPQLGSGWTATRATWVKRGAPQADGTPAVGNTWSMAWISPDQRYVGLIQRDTFITELIAAASRHGTADGTTTVKAATWQRYVSADQRTRALVLSDGTVATVVSGDVPYADLERFAASLA